MELIFPDVSPALILVHFILIFNSCGCGNQESTFSWLAIQSIRQNNTGKLYLIKALLQLLFLLFKTLVSLPSLGLGQPAEHCFALISLMGSRPRSRKSNSLIIFWNGNKYSI